MAGATARSIILPPKTRLSTAPEYMTDDPDDPLKPCPLMPAHRILSSRMALHLVKCREAQAQTIPLTQCKFDSTHWVPKKELSYHMAVECDKRGFFENFLMHPDESESMAKPPYQPPELPQFEENWDDEPNVCYDPTMKAENEAVLRTHAVASKKERKRFRNEERRRLQGLEREGKLLPGTYTKPPPQPQPPQLRPPHKDTLEQIAYAMPKKEIEKSTPATSGVTPAVTTGVTCSFAQMSLDSAPPKKNDAWVCVDSKGRRKKTGKKQ